MRYAKRKGKSRGFSAQTARKFLSECYGIDPNVLYGDIKHRNTQQCLRFCEMLISFYKGEPIKTSYLRHENYPLPEKFDIVTTEFIEYQTKMNTISETTIKHCNRVARQFLHFVNAKGIDSCENIDENTVNGWILSIEKLRPVTIKGYCYCLKKFLTWLYKSEQTSNDLSSVVPSVRLWRLSQIPSVWQKDDLTKLLSSVDRGSPIGKRDYAILLLAAGLGLRASDIKTLKMDNCAVAIINNNNCVKVTIGNYC